MQGGGGLVAALTLQFGGIGIGLKYIALLHGQEYLVCLNAQSRLNLIYEIHKLYGLGATYIIYLPRDVVGTGLGNRLAVNHLDGALNYVINVCEVAAQVTVVEYLDGLSLADGRGKEHGCHVGAAPRTVYGKEPEAGGGQAVELAV